MDRTEFERQFKSAIENVKTKGILSGICIHLKDEGRLWVTRVLIRDNLIYLYDGSRYSGVIDLSIVESVE